MIEKILERLEAEANKSYNAYTVGFISDDRAEYDAYTHAIEIVQEVAKKYNEPVNKRCLTCTHYDGEEIVDNICYLCCKGFEDNYVAKMGGKA